MVLYKKALGCLLGGLIGDAIGTPTEGMDYRQIEARFGWVNDFDCDGTDDTVMKVLLAEAMIAIARESEESPALVTGAPTSTPVGRMDEACAARELDVCSWDCD